MNAAKLTYANGTSYITEMNGTDVEVLEYFKIGRVFNIGDGENDNMQKIVSCKIVK